MENTVQELVNETSDIYDLSPQTTSILILNILTAITAFIGNVLIIVALQKASSLHPHTKLLFCSLACTDLCIGLITQPLYITSFLMSQGKCHGIVTTLIDITSTLFGGVSMFTVTAISVDRLLALLLGLRYRWVVTYKRVRVLLFVFWVCCSASALMFFYNHTLAIGITSIGLFLCILVSTCSYTKIFLTLRHHKAKVQDCVNQRQPKGGARYITRYRKTVSSALWVQVAMLACFLPYATCIGIFSIFKATGSQTKFPYMAWEVTLSFYYFNSSLNPLLYCWKIKEVRQAVKDTIKKLNCC